MTRWQVQQSSDQTKQTFLKVITKAKEEHHIMVKRSIQEDIALDIINMDLIPENILYNANINRHKGIN